MQDAPWRRATIFNKEGIDISMVTERITKLGFAKDENNSKLNEVFKDNVRLKEIHIDIYATNPLVSSSSPHMLLLRTIERKILVKNSGNRLVLKKVIDGFDTYFMNVLSSEIKDCYYKDLNEFSEFVLNIQNIYYKIIIYN
jgi:hypothetical protein